MMLKVSMRKTLHNLVTKFHHDVISQIDARNNVIVILADLIWETLAGIIPITYLTTCQQM